MYIGDQEMSDNLLSNTIKLIPGSDWNTFNPTNSSKNAEKRFVNVNAILIYSNDNLWVVDSGIIGNKTFENGSKLVQIDINKNIIERIYYT